MVGLIKSSLFLNQFPGKHLWQRASQTVNTDKKQGHSVTDETHRVTDGSVCSL